MEAQKQLLAEREVPSLLMCRSIASYVSLNGVVCIAHLFRMYWGALKPTMSGNCAQASILAKEEALREGEARLKLTAGRASSERSAASCSTPPPASLLMYRSIVSYVSLNCFLCSAASSSTPPPAP